MAAFPDGVPCWADAMVSDLEAAKSFYGEVLGWTFDSGSPGSPGSPESGDGIGSGVRTEARSDGLRVAALVPTPAGTAGSPRWSVHFASSQVDETARRIEAAGGRAVVGPGDAAGIGRTMTAQDPEGTVFGVREAGDRAVFEKRGEPGSYVWADICVRDTASADAFYPQVMPLKAVPLEDRGTESDYKVLKVGDHAVAGRLRMDASFPAEEPPHVLVYFAVDDCDRAVGIARKLGGELRSGPTDSRFGRFAVVSDQQGTVFAVLDPTTTTAERPE